MKEYYKKFFEHNISSVFMIEIRKPVSISLPVNKQIQIIFENAIIKDINKATVEMYMGKGIDDKSFVLGKKLTSLWTEKDYKTEDAPVFQFYKTFVECNYDIKNVESKAETPKGENVWFLVSMKGIIENNNLVGWWGSQLDITQLKTLNQQLENTNKELQDKLEEIEQYTYLSSHSLQNPLHNLENLSSLLIRNYQNKLDSNGIKSIKYLKDSSSKLSKILHQMVYYFNISANTKLKKINLQNIINKIIVEKNKVNPNETITFDELPTIIGNEEQIEKLFLVLVENAIIHNSNKENLKITIHHKISEDEIKFSVIDNGIGIPDKDQSKIFKMHESNTGYGNGMSLAIAKKIVGNNNGKIWIESKMGEGTKVHFTMKRKQGL